MRSILRSLLARPIALSLSLLVPPAAFATTPSLEAPTVVLGEFHELQGVWRSMVNRLQTEEPEAALDLPWDLVGPLQAAAQQLSADARDRGAPRQRVLSALRSLSRGAFNTLGPNLLERQTFVEALDTALPQLVTSTDWPRWQGGNDPELQFFGPLALTGVELADLTQGSPDRAELLERLLSREPELADTLSQDSLLALLPRLQAAGRSSWQPPPSIAEAFKTAVTPRHLESN